MSITSGLAPIRNYANGGDVNTERQNMLAKLGFPSGITNEQLDAAIAKEKNAAYLPESQDPGTTVGQLPGLFKENVFDPTDPVDILTLPFVSLKAAKGIGKFGENIYNKVRGSGGKIRENLRGISAYVGTDMLADEIRDDSDPFFTKQEDGTYESTRPLPDAQDEAQEDLEDANKKEEEDKEDKELTKKEKGVKALGRFLESLGDSGSQSSSTPGYMIKGTSISTPQITRYEEGGIASLEPEMMADGGIAKFFNGGKVVKGALNKGRKYLADRKQKKADVAQEKADKAKAKVDEAEAKAKKAEAKAKKAEIEVKETGVTKDKPSGDVDSFIPPGIAMFGSKATDLVKQIPNPKRQAGRAVFYGAPAITGLSYGADALFGDDKNKPPTGGSDTAAVPEIEESDALLDIIRQTSLERAQAAGRTEPSFVDYLASFPSSYMEKVERDPEFAKQMMAGFTAMTRTTEGFAPRNAFTDFVQGVEAERIRQEDATPDQLKLLAGIESGQVDIQTLRDLARPEVDPDKRATLGSLLLDDAKKVVGASVNRTIGRKEELVDSDGQLVTVGKLISVYESGGQPALDQYYRTLLPLEG